MFTPKTVTQLAPGDNLGRGLIVRTAPVAIGAPYGWRKRKQRYAVECIRYRSWQEFYQVRQEFTSDNVFYVEDW